MILSFSVQPCHEDAEGLNIKFCDLETDAWITLTMNGLGEERCFSLQEVLGNIEVFFDRVLNDPDVNNADQSATRIVSTLCWKITTP
jgi:hypothetical protein